MLIQRKHNWLKKQSVFILTFCLSLILLKGCGHTSPAPIVARSHGIPNAHKVFPGESLYSIAWRYGLDYQELARINHVKPPYHIHPGQIITLDETKKTGMISLNQLTESFKSSIKSKQPTKQTKYQPILTEPTTWIWPTQGEVTDNFSSSNKGINISGKHGQAIMAIANGQVVYAGSGIIGYGKLILLKHSSNYLSAYAHNHTLLVREGDYVKQGTVIARMGKTDAKHVHLHFELRKNGKPVDPIKYFQ